MTGWSDKGSRHARGYGSRWDKLRLVILKRDGYLCQACKLEGRTTPAREVDHITPKAKGGTDEHSNLQALCSPCHKIKTARDEGRRVRRVFGADGPPAPQASLPGCSVPGQVAGTHETATPDVCPPPRPAEMPVPPPVRSALPSQGISSANATHAAFSAALNRFGAAPRGETFGTDRSRWRCGFFLSAPP
ncbi:hypothetical protein Shpa_1 [Paracoccus phage Shpa]|uniref:HNH nuclease domain-containing protein n=1 Tax=Paracoccus phage Shpa TaxID=1647282 RepID=A0A0U2C119_9CAUD|nr:HNH endonuclease [Paracoccus phage Shpa]AKG94512.1 hypothetical protein Shpa_1 [Paracoccus phage Shpa]